MVVGGGMVVAVGYAMVINMMATREVWPFFAIGFAFAAISQLTLIALGAIGVAIAFMTSTFLNKVAEMVAELQLVLATQSAISWKTTRKGCSHG